MGSRKKRKAGRELAFDALHRVESRGAFSDIALESLFAKRRPDRPERALASEIAFGVLRWRALLDWRIARLIDRSLKRVERGALLALRIGAYQLTMLDRIPASAAVNESVNLAPPRARGFVNAVLRKMAGESDWESALAAIEDPIERLSVTHSHPRWMVEAWVDRLGEASAAELLESNNRRPRLCLRVNSTRTGREAFLRLLERAGVASRPGRLSPLAVIVDQPIPVNSLPGYDDGLFAVQDEASQLVPIILAPRPGETILDACAAPGTKSLEIMQLMGGKGRVVAVDLHPGRLRRMSAETRRLGLSNVTRVVGDSTMPFGYGPGPAKDKGGAPCLPVRMKGVLFDRALVDAPCTGLGTIRRRPDIKWRRKPDDIKPRAQLQRAILENVARYLKPGGVLAYSTCTFTVEENEWAVAGLLHSGDFGQLDPAEIEGHFSAGEGFTGLCENKMLRTWPHLTGADGFTVFRLKKAK